MTEYPALRPEDLATLARVLFDARGNSSALASAISTQAVALVPGAQFVSVVVVNKDRLEQTAATDDLADICDTLQAEIGESPSRHAAALRATVLIEDLARETRWPQFTDSATQVGARSLLCVPFEAGPNSTAVVNLYSAAANAFPDDSQVAAELFTAHAAVAFTAAREQEQLQHAVESRDTIGQAKGMLMERFGVGSDQAFALLRRLSQDTNVKLAQLAQRVVDTGSG